MKSIFVYNPESGNGVLKKHIPYILKELTQKYGQVDVVPTTHAGHATTLAREAVGRYDYFFCAGGDGTVNEVVNGFGSAENKPIIGYIPCGTVNDVARSLGLSKNIVKATKNLVDGQVRTHDIFKVNDRYGIYVCCAGLFTKSSYDTKRSLKKRLGRIAYFFKGAKDVFDAKPVQVQLITESEVINQSCAMVLILNSRSVAGFKFNKQANLTDGEVEVVLFHSHKNKVYFSEIINCMKAFIFGLNHAKKQKKVTYRKLSKFTIKTSEGTIINLDGEKSSAGSFKFNVIKGGVKILCPTQR